MKLIDIDQAARRLSVSPSTVRRMLRTRGCPLQACRVHKGCIRIVEESVEQLIRLRVEEFAGQEWSDVTNPANPATTY
jgi:DeoR/GlpR family transcriptional regulator of sugar metabolism